MTLTSEQQEKLAWIRGQIKMLRDFLATAKPVTSISVNGMSMTLNREDARKELKELEQEELDLLRPNRHVKNIDLGNAW